MTLYELWLVLAKRWKMLVFIPLLCAVACGAVLLVSTLANPAGAYTATARIITNSQVQTVAGFASSEARQCIIRLYGEEPPDDAMVVTAKGSSDTMTVTVTAKGPDADLCVKTVNEIAEAANSTAEKAFSDIAELPYAGSIEPAAFAQDSSIASDTLRYLLVAIFGGLFVAACIAVVLDLRKHAVKTAEGAQQAVKLPVLETLPASNGERLLANVRFAAKKEGVASAYIVPAGDEEAARVAFDTLKEANASENDASRVLDVKCGAPLSESMKAAYEAQESDAVVVSVRQWADTMSELENTVAELRLAGVNLVGLVFVKDKLS